MAEGGSWGRIQTQGLLSTSALLAQFEVKEPERNRIESEWRGDRIPLEEGATIRDQRPMPQKALQNVLKDMTPTQWYRLLNGKTFFWTTQDRLQKMLNAKPYRNDSQDVITVDTRKLVDRHQEQITLSRINSGSTNGQARRGSRTFQDYRRVSSHPPKNRCRRIDRGISCASHHGLCSFGRKLEGRELPGDHLETRGRRSLASGPTFHPTNRSLFSVT